MTAHRIIKNLTRQGNVMLGVGCYSAALAARNNAEVAIKVGTNLDDPWLDYRGLVIAAHADNPHVPQINSFYQDQSNEFYVCTMERLDATKYHDEALIDSVREFVEGWHSDEKFLALVAHYPQRVPDPQKLLELLNAIKQNTTHFKSGRPVGVGTYTWWDGEDDDDSYEGRKLDMHRGNFMLRGEVLVVTDPWCNVSMEDVSDLSQWAERTLEYCE
jgi:hypothetical protein